jgi:hypothetical protein
VSGSLALHPHGGAGSPVCPLTLGVRPTRGVGETTGDGPAEPGLSHVRPLSILEVVA